MSDILDKAESNFKCARCKGDIYTGERYLAWKRRLCISCTKLECHTKLSYYRAMVSELRIWERIDSEVSK